MGTVRVGEGLLFLSSKEAEEKVTELCNNGTLWEYLSVLIEESVKRETSPRVNPELEQMKGMLETLIKQVSGGAPIMTVQHNESQEEEPIESKVETVEINKKLLSNMGDLLKNMKRMNE